MTTSEPSSSPNWNNTTKLVVGLTLAGLLILLIIRFQNILAPLLVSILLAYLFHPLATFFNRKFKDSMGGDITSVIPDSFRGDHRLVDLGRNFPR